ncbi:MAG: hypothetical protein WD894_15315, partial [Pirellulales bacterium]
GYGVYGQRYAADGSTLGGEFQVNTTTTQNQEFPSAAMDEAGNFVVTWMSWDQDGSGYGVYGQRYAADGSTLGGEFQVNTTTASHQVYPSVAMDDAGNFVVTWSSLGRDGSGYDVYGQRYAANGSALGGEFQVNMTTHEDQNYASVAMDDAGNFVVTWTSFLQDGGGYGGYGQRYAADGSALGGEFPVNATTTENQLYASVAMDDAGNFVVTWTSFLQDGSGWGVYGRRYAPDGSDMSGEFQVNTTTNNHQMIEGWTGATFVGMSDSGDFVVTWQSSGQDGSGWGVFAQRFTFAQSLSENSAPTANAGADQTVGEGKAVLLSGAVYRSGLGRQPHAGLERAGRQWPADPRWFRCDVRLHAE